MSSYRRTVRSNCLLPSRFPTKLGKHSDTCYMTCTAYSPWFDHRTNIWWSVQFMELFIIQFSPTFYYIPILVAHILFGSLFWNADRMFFRYSNIKYFTPHRAVSRLVLCIWMFTFWTGGVMSLYVGQHFESNVTVPVRLMTTGHSSKVQWYCANCTTCLESLHQ
jgi:hypothetical protein